MKDLSQLTPGELAAFIQTHLRAKGIDVVLTGGAAVSVYTDNQYLSRDIDLISTTLENRKHLKQVMQELGFEEQNRYFSHPQTSYLVEFPAGPLSIGKQPIDEINEIELSTGTLRILTPSDCVKDRLSAYYFWDDNQALEQAILVARNNKINLPEIKTWSVAEGMQPKFEEYQRQLVNAGKRP